MSDDVIVTAKEMLVLCIDEPNRPSEKNPHIRKPAWKGVLEWKCQDATMSQIVDYMGKPEHVVRILKIGEYGSVENITDAVLDWAEAPDREGRE